MRVLVRFLYCVSVASVASGFFALAHIVGCVSEVGLDETRLGSLCELKASVRKSKSHFNKKANTPSKRARVTKSNIGFS